jgi:predicted house-cleaning noncanonical NTP pyrophosphatase (MazG superfamily)
MRFKAAKLIRDNMIKIWKQENIECKYKIMHDAEYTNALYAKIFEEIQEAKEAKTIEKCLSELADALEALRCLTNTYDSDLEELIGIADKKRFDKGSYVGKIYCTEIEMDENNPNISNYLEKCDKYPEIR